MKRIALALALLAAGLLAGCGSKCGPNNCSGCCDASGACVSPSANACGLGGAACQVCLGAQQCAGGVCQSPTSGAGGAGGTTSGTSTSSGSASSGSSGTATSSSSTGATTSSSSTTSSTGSSSSSTGSTGSTGSSSSSTSSSSTSSSSSTGSSSSGSTGALSPDVILVVDRSGSMADAPDGTQSNVCPQSGQQNLNCKWDELLTAITGDADPSAGFLGQLAGQFPSSNPAQLGLVTFSGYDPASGGSIQNSCSPAVVQQQLTTLDISQVAATNNLLLAIPPGGGTPTANALGVAGQTLAADTSGRAGYVVLLTDGAPNCNSNFQATATNCSPNTDRCVSYGYCYGQTSPPVGCLDETDTVSAVQALAGVGVKTVVIGFGADFADGGTAVVQTLDEMATAGGLPRTYPDGGPAEPAFYDAASSTDLQAALQAVLGQIH